MTGYILTHKIKFLLPQNLIACKALPQGKLCDVVKKKSPGLRIRGLAGIWAMFSFFNPHIFPL